MNSAPLSAWCATAMAPGWCHTESSPPMEKQSQVINGHVLFTARYGLFRLEYPDSNLARSGIFGGYVMPFRKVHPILLMVSVLNSPAGI